MKKDKDNAYTDNLGKLVKQDKAMVVRAPVKSKAPAAAAMLIDPLKDDKQFDDLKTELK